LVARNHMERKEYYKGGEKNINRMSRGLKGEPAPHIWHVSPHANMC